MYACKNCIVNTLCRIACNKLIIDNNLKFNDIIYMRLMGAAHAHKPKRFIYKRYEIVISKYAITFTLDGRIHREEDQPAVIHSDGSKFWYKFGLPHRDGDKPAVIYSNRGLKWFKEGKLHREGNKPALINKKNGYKAWYIDGEEYRWKKSALVKIV